MRASQRAYKGLNISPVIIPLLSFFLGVLAERFFRINITVPVFILGSGLIYGLIFVLRGYGNAGFLSCISILLFITGAFRMHTSLILPPDNIAMHCSNTPVTATIIAEITSYPEKKKNYSIHEFTAKAGRLFTGGAEYKVNGRILVKIYDNNRYFYGDIIAVKGDLYAPSGMRNPEGFDYREYLFKKGITAILRVDKSEQIIKLGTRRGLFPALKRKILKFREKTGELFDSYLGYPAAGIARALFLGLRNGLDENIKEPFIRTGTMHIMAISGLHLSLLVGLLMVLFGFLTRKSVFFYMMFFILIPAFVIFTGSRIPVLRAAVMFSVMIAGKILNRRAGVVHSLLLAAFVICFFRPVSIFTNEFILSFTAVAAIIIWDRHFKLKKKGPGKDVLTYFFNFAGLSFIIWLIISPLLAGSFNKITPSVILANAIAVPLVYIMFILCFVFVFFSYIKIAFFLTLICVKSLTLVTGTLYFVLREIAALPFACLNIATPSTISTGIYYFCIFLLLFPGRGLPKIKKLIILILIAANIFIWNECFAVTPRALTVTFFDVGQADASIIETPSGKVILVDGASGGGRYGRDSGRKVIAEYLFQRRIRKLDMVILSHAHFDHIGGLEYILNNFDVEVFVNGPGNDNRLYREMMSIIRSKGIKHILVRQGDVMKIGGCFTMRVFNPFRPSDLSLNDKSLVIKIIHLDSGKSILYCGDIENPGIKNVTAFGKSLKADILKVPHHGSGNCDQSLFEIFIDNVSAEYAVVTNGKSLTEDNNVAVSLKERGIKTYFSANDGAVVFKAGNKGFFVKKYIDPGGYKMLSRKIKIRDNSE